MIFGPTIYYWANPLHYEISNRAFFLLLNQSRPGSNGTSSTRQKDPCWGPTGEGR